MPTNSELFWSIDRLAPVQVGNTTLTIDMINRAMDLLAERMRDNRDKICQIKYFRVTEIEYEDTLCSLP